MADAGGERTRFGLGKKNSGGKESLKEERHFGKGADRKGHTPKSRGPELPMGKKKTGE